MPGFIHQALTNGCIRMDYSGYELRTVCYVRDAIEIMWNVLLHGKEPVYNVGGQTTTNMADIAVEIGDIVDAVVFHPVHDGELPGSGNALMDISRIQKEFGKENFVSLREGLRNTIEWSRDDV